MNLTFHQLRKDVRQFRAILLIWGLMLALGLAMELGWLGGRPQLNENGLSADGLLAGLQTFFLWVLFLLLPAAVVLADSPGRREGFLRTRPLPGRDLWQAKAHFVGLLVLLPALLQEWIYLTVSGLPAGYVWHGVGERWLYALPIVTVSAAFASLWRSYAQWTLGLALAVGGMLVGATLIELLGSLVGQRDVLDGHSTAAHGSRALAALYVFSLVFVAVAVGHARCAWRPVGRWSGIVSAIGVFFWVNACWPWDFFKLIPADPAAARAVVRQAPFKVTPEQLRVLPWSDNSWNQGSDFGVFIQSEINRSIAPNVVEWNGRHIQMVGAAGQTVAPVRGPDAHFSQRAYVYPSPAELNIWAGLLPKNALFLLGQFASPGQPLTFLGAFRLDSPAFVQREPVTFKADMVGRVYRWDQVADLALNQGNTPVTVKDGCGSWTLFGAYHHDQEGYSILLKRSQVSFATSSDERTAAFSFGPRERYDFVLYHPGRNITLISGYNFENTTRAGSTALVQHWMNLGFNQDVRNTWKLLSGEELAQCRLLIFQRTWLGTVPADWQSPAVVVNERLNSGSIRPNNANPQNGLSLSEIRRRLAELPLPGPAAARVEVGRYLLQAVPIMDASRYGQIPGEATIAQLATLVPTHLEVLLDGLPAMGHPSQQVVIQAIIRGAEEAQEKAILAALPEHPDLMPVLLQRGWLADARPALDQLLASPQPLSFETLQAIASFADPATYPRLLTEFEANPRPDLYDLLRTLPGMAEPLDAVVARLWRDHDVLMQSSLNDFYPVLSVALHAGQREALQLAYRLLAETKPAGNSGADNWELAQLFRENVYVAATQPDDFNDLNHVLKRMRAYQPDSFVFDPVRGHFGLKP